MSKFKEKFLTFFDRLKDSFYDFKYGDKKEFFKKNIILISITCIIIIFSVGFFFGNIISTKEGTLKKLQRGLVKGSVSTLDDVIKIDGEKATKEELKPLSDYYKGKDTLVNNLIDDIKDDKSKIMKLTSSKSLFLENYSLDLNTFTLTIENDNKDADLYLNDKEVKGTTEIKGLIPGEYKLKGVVKSEFGDIKKEESILLMKDEKVNFKIGANFITLHSNFDDAKVFINGEDSNKTVKEFKNAGPFPSDGSVKISIEKDLPWGKVKSEEVQIKDKPDITINLNIKNDELFNEVQTLVDNFYDSVFKALNEENKELINAATNEAKDKVFGVLEKKYFFLKNQYEITGINIDKEKSKFTYENGEFKGSVVCDVNYDVSKVLFGLGKESKNTKFFTKIIFKDGKWVVSDVENFTLS
ncbi:MAG: TcaA 3rd/4th domain-containing protein [Clostridium sp.]|uniref:TcaA 3rd/4th domain-containing protein n=1 Tax=Clostridium TaxID=1485 RepID=UPI002152A900|nr:hypothetical protein [Clostridium sp. LY3-2]MCR6515607.1 hypothetical protein [Clostridium sp. LY3-2]